MRIKILPYTLILFSVTTYLFAACSNEDIDKAQNSVIEQKSIPSQTISAKNNKISNPNSSEEIDKILGEIDINIKETEEAKEGIEKARKETEEAKEGIEKARQEAAIWEERTKKLEKAMEGL